jgi:hypothetical protein
MSKLEELCAAFANNKKREVISDEHIVSKDAAINNNPKLFKPFLNSDEVYDFNIIIVKAPRVSWVTPDIEEYVGVSEGIDDNTTYYSGCALRMDFRDDNGAELRVAIVSKGLQQLDKDKTYDKGPWEKYIYPKAMNKVMKFCKENESFTKTSTGMRVLNKFDFDNWDEFRVLGFSRIAKVKNSWQVGCRKW